MQSGDWERSLEAHTHSVNVIACKNPFEELSKLIEAAERFTQEISYLPLGEVARAVENSRNAWVRIRKTAGDLCCSGDSLLLGSVFNLERFFDILSGEEFASIALSPGSEELLMKAVRENPQFSVSEDLELILGHAKSFLKEVNLEELFKLYEEEEDFDSPQVLALFLLAEKTPGERRLELSWRLLQEDAYCDVTWERIPRCGEEGKYFNLQWPAPVLARVFPVEWESVLRSEEVYPRVIEILLEAWKGSAEELIRAAKSLGKEEGGRS